MSATTDPIATPFPSRRSVVHSTNGIVSSSQPLANQAGIRILERGGNAADAAVAVAAALNVTEPMSTGIGGDMFCLFYDASTKSVRALNGSGRSAESATLARVRHDLGLGPVGNPERPEGAGQEQRHRQRERDGSEDVMPARHIHSITVPGAAAGWVDCVEQFGSGNVSLADVLEPAIELCERGFPVSEVCADVWAMFEDLLKKTSPETAHLMLKREKMPAGKTTTAATTATTTTPDLAHWRAPRPGELMRFPVLAKTFRILGSSQKQGFYTGPVADRIVDAVSLTRPGLLSHDDLAHHASLPADMPDPLTLRLRLDEMAELDDGTETADQRLVRPDGSSDRDIDVWEHPPNGQGLVALIALGLLQEFIRSGKVKPLGPADHNSAEYIHALVEALRLAFADGRWSIGDPDRVDGSSDLESIAGLLNPKYLAERAQLFDPDKALSPDNVRPGFPPAGTGNNDSKGKDEQRRQPTVPPHQSDTVYFTVVDGAGNAASFINSLYYPFGSAVVVPEFGFLLQNRGATFALGPEDHPNVFGPRKRPYHTIIPALITAPEDGGEGAGAGAEAETQHRLRASYGVMGGFMQPQGHVQVLANVFLFQMTPQLAVDAPRVFVNFSARTDVLAETASGHDGGEKVEKEGKGEETEKGGESGEVKGRGEEEAQERRRRGGKEVDEERKGKEQEEVNVQIPRSGNSPSIGTVYPADKSDPSHHRSHSPSRSERRTGQYTINLEAGIAPSVAARLEELGHTSVVHSQTGRDRARYGKAQFVLVRPNDDDDDGGEDGDTTDRQHRRPFVFSAGSDMRGDGAAVAAL